MVDHHQKSNDPCRNWSYSVSHSSAPVVCLSLSGASPRASALSSLSPAPHVAAPPSLVVYVFSLSCCLIPVYICIYGR